MEQTREAITQNLAERLCWQAAQRDDARVARRLYRKGLVDGVYRLDEGALLDDFFHFLRELGLLEVMEGVQAAALQREMVPVVQYLRLYGLKTLFGIESMNALPALLFSDEALMQLVGFNAQQVRHGVCQRGAAKRQRPRSRGPIGPETLAKNIVQLNLRDLQAWFPKRATLTFDRRVLLREYEAACHEEMTSPQAIAINLLRAAKLIDMLGNLSTVDEVRARRWRQERATQVARKTVNLEHDVLRQLLDHCQRLGWRTDNPARGLKKLEWKMARLPRALTYIQVQQALECARELGDGAPPESLQAQLYRLIVAGIFFGLRRGELQHLLWSDTTGRQVYIQGKVLPDGGSWRPKDREARVIGYPGMERPIAVVFGEEPREGYVFSPVRDRRRPFVADWLSQSAERVLKPLSPELSLHSLRHTFASWRLEMGDSLVRVQALMGHSSAQTLLRYAHVEPEPMHDLLPLL